MAEARVKAIASMSLMKDLMMVGVSRIWKRKQMVRIVIRKIKMIRRCVIRSREQSGHRLRGRGSLGRCNMMDSMPKIRKILNTPMPKTMKRNIRIQIKLIKTNNLRAKTRNWQLHYPKPPSPLRKMLLLPKKITPFRLSKIKRKYLQQKLF